MLGDHIRRMINDVAGMHEYSYVLFLGFMVVPASGPKDLFVEHVTMCANHGADMGRRSQVAC
jgi:hypothetical protein